MILDKSEMSEEDVKLQYITPAILAKWDCGHVTMETRITDGRINLKGNFVVREKPKKADYVLYLKKNKPIAIVEAKDNSYSVSYGLQQAITYAKMMDIPFAYSSNGDGFQEHDLLTGIERTLTMDEFPSPEELSARWERESNGGKGLCPEEKMVVMQPYFSSQGTYDPRYYQRNAINRVVEADVKSHFPADLASSETADLFMSVIMYRLKKNGRAAVILPDGFLFGTDNAKLSIKKKLLSEFNLHTVIRLPGSVFSPYTSITTNILFFDNTKPTEETWFYRLDMPEGYKHFSKTKPMKLEHFDPVAEWWNDRRDLSVDGFDKAKKFTARELAEELGYNFDQCGYPHVEEEILDPMDLIRRYQDERSALNAEIDRTLAEIVAKLGGAE